jgi:hypothetical protein
MLERWLEKAPLRSASLPAFGSWERRGAVLEVLNEDQADTAGKCGGSDRGNREPDEAAARGEEGERRSRCCRESGGDGPPLVP